jgi:hypothetical protein
MAGSKIALTPRDQRLLGEIQRFGVLTREQTMRLGLFASKTRANERLKKLVIAEYLTARPQAVILGAPRLVYSAGRLTTEPIERKRRREASDMLLAHQLGLVDIRIAFERTTRVQRWLTDRELSMAGLAVIPDGLVEYELHDLGYSAFIEYDRGTEPLHRIQGKVRGYVDLAHSGRFARVFKRRFFRVLFVSDQPGRVASIVNTAASVTHQMVWVAALSDLTQHGPLAPIWRRPDAAHLQSLTGE